MSRWIEENSDRERERERSVEIRQSLALPAPSPLRYFRGRAAKTIRLGNEKWNAKSFGTLLHE